MCTMTWVRRPDGYDLLCNRDERVSRLPATGPEVRELRGLRCISPADGDFGGTWITVNELGVTLCLLNAYGDEVPEPADGWTSRGLLLSDLADSDDAQDARRRILDRDLSVFRPFVLVIAVPHRSPTQVRWTGRSLELDGAVRPPIVSSGGDERAARESRREQLESLLRTARRPNLALLEGFHRSHEPERGPLSVCVHAGEAKTVSMSVVSVRESMIAFRYEPGSPCERSTPEEVAIARIPYRLG